MVTHWRHFSRGEAAIRKGTFQLSGYGSCWDAYNRQGTIGQSKLAGNLFGLLQLPLTASASRPSDTSFVRHHNPAAARRPPATFFSKDSSPSSPGHFTAPYFRIKETEPV